MTLAGFFAPICVYAVITLLHRVLPVRKVDGYAIDPETGRPYRYRLNADGTYVLYSVGWNQRDDGGVEVKEGNGVLRDYTKGDWVWPVVRKAENGVSEVVAHSKARAWRKD